jgi:hypothetical protein
MEEWESTFPTFIALGPEDFLVSLFSSSLTPLDFLVAFGGIRNW